MKNLLGLVLIASTGAVAGNAQQQDHNQQQDHTQQQNHAQQQQRHEQHQDQHQGQNRDQNQDQSQDNRQERQERQEQAPVVVATPPSCPNGSNFPVSCVSAGGLSVVLCPEDNSRTDAVLVINGFAYKAKLDGNYAAYADYRAEYNGMTYELGLTNKNGQYASGFISMTSSLRPYMSEAVDLSCVLPF